MNPSVSPGIVDGRVGPFDGSLSIARPDLPEFRNVPVGISLDHFQPREHTVLACVPINTPTVSLIIVSVQRCCYFV